VVYNRYASLMSSSAMSQIQSIYKTDFNPMTLLVNIKDLIAQDTKVPPPANAMLMPYYSPTDQDDKTLVFESRFESGNLAMVFKLCETEYNLVLQNDINTRGHTQCKEQVELLLGFFFRV